MELDFDPERLIIAMRPVDDVEMMEVGDDDPIIVTLIGKKSYLLTLVSTLASAVDEDPNL